MNSFGSPNRTAKGVQYHALFYRNPVLQKQDPESPEHCSVQWLSDCQGQRYLNARVMAARPALSVMHTARSKIPLEEMEQLSSLVTPFTRISVF